ncbi:MAG: helix-turn-helix domain-containing protein [Pseudomonadota bacterium]
MNDTVETTTGRTKTVPDGAALYTYEDLQAKFRLPKPTILAMMKDGTFPSARLLHPNGRRRYWIAEEVDAWKANLQPAPISQSFCETEF